MKLTKNQILAKSFLQLLLDGFKLFFKSALFIIPFFFCFNLVPIFISSIFLADFIWHNVIYYAFSTLPILLADFYESIILRTFSIISFCPIAIFFYEKYTKDESSFTKSFKTAINYKIILVLVMYAIAIPILYFMSFIFVFLVYVFIPFYLINDLVLLVISRLIQILITSIFIFMVFTYNIRDKKSTFFKTNFYRRGAFLKILLLIGIYIVIIEVFGFILSLFWNPTFLEIYSWYDINNRRYDLIIINNFINALPHLILGALQIGLLTPLFAQQIAKKRHLFEPKIVENSQSKEESEISVGQANYCKYCGKALKTDERFCLYCGKILK